MFGNRLDDLLLLLLLLHHLPLLFLDMGFDFLRLGEKEVSILFGFNLIRVMPRDLQHGHQFPVFFLLCHIIIYLKNCEY